MMTPPPTHGDGGRRLHLNRSVGREGRVGTNGSAASRAGRSVGPSRPEICSAALRAEGRSVGCPDSALHAPGRPGRSVGRAARPNFFFAALRAAGRSVGSTESETLPTATRESVGGYAKLTFNFASPGVQIPKPLLEAQICRNLNAQNSLKIVGLSESPRARR